MVLLRTHNERSSDNEEETNTTGPTGSGQQQQQQQNESIGTNNYSTNDSPDILLKLLLDAGKKLCHQIKRTSNFVMVDLGGYQLFDRLAQWCVQHPQIALCLFAAGLVMFLPFLILVGFGLSTVLMALTGFLVLEGTLLTILSMMLFGLLGALTIVLLFFAVIAVATYFGFVRIYGLYGNVESYKSALSQYLQKENAHLATTRTNQMENSRDEIVS